MKQVITEKLLENVINVNDVNAYGQAIFLITTEKEVYILTHWTKPVFYENEGGWIFKKLSNYTFGHSGFHKTPEEAINKAMQHEGTTVFVTEKSDEVAIAKLLLPQ